MLQFEGGRTRPVDYIAWCNNVADQYPMGIPHGLQKDAIQNSIDARKGKKPVKICFEIITNKKGTFLAITDTNTKGLTGNIMVDKKSYQEELGPEDHWARFESFAFTKTDPDAIGARGQGKFMFLRSSKSYIMFYDTLRSDGIYRLGATQAQVGDCPIFPGPGEEPWENGNGQRLLENTVDSSRLMKLELG